MSTTTIPQIIEKTIDVLGAKFGTTGAHLWDIIVRQQVINGFTDVIIGVIATLLGIGLFLWGYKAIREATKKDQEPSEFAIFNVVLGPIGIIVGAAILIKGITFIINPEFHALKFILSQIH